MVKMLHLGLLALSAALCEATKLIIKPDNAKSFTDPKMPHLLNFTESQFSSALGTSYWTTTFLTASDKHQYLIVSHALLSYFGVEDPDITARYSILDITDPSRFWVYLGYVPTPESFAGPDNRLSIDYPSFGFKALTDDSVSKIQAWGERPDFGFNLTFEATTQVLVNNGGGTWNWGTGNTTEWALPSCRTTGTLTLDEKVLTIDPANSFTWYDRQFSHGAPLGNWTWFELNFPKSEIKASIWAIDSNEPSPGNWRFATVRTKTGLEILTIDFDSSKDKTWTSPDSNITYPLQWDLKFSNGDYLSISSMRPEQEMYGNRSATDIAYEGGVVAKGSFMGQKTGFGVVEIVQTI
ncbi:hypothetical protein BKA56DRAFT_312224 [Ilyonectria sp. MPI-CAGE-AT-0026]|nr:hypothetical protein BKA56DRAFT_312224 [Ilyonectria sp. MPI-CAGE-AT-0026]